MATETGSKATPPLYKMPQRYRDQTFWVRRPRAKLGRKPARFSTSAIGDALSSWEFVETATSMLFEVMIESNTVAAGRAYGSITGARARADVLRQAGDVYFSIRRHLSDKKDRAFAETVKHMEECFNAYVANYVGASARRNDIAHGIATELNTVEDGSQSWFLVPPLYQSSRNVNWIEDDIKLRTRTGLTLAQKEARLEFNKLYISNTQYVYGVSDIKVIAGENMSLGMVDYRAQKIGKLPKTPEDVEKEVVILDDGPSRADRKVVRRADFSPCPSFAQSDRRDLE